MTVFKANVSRDACSASTGNQTITADLDGLTPKAAFFILSGATSNGVAADNCMLSYGAATGYRNQWCMSQVDYDGSTIERDGHYERTNCIHAIDPTHTAASIALEGAASFVEFIENGVVVNWHDTMSEQFLLTTVLFAGNELQAYAKSPSQLSYSASEGVVEFSGVGFSPQFVLSVNLEGITDYFSYRRGCVSNIGFTRIYDSESIDHRSLSWQWRGNFGADFDEDESGTKLRGSDDTQYIYPAPFTGGREPVNAEITQVFSDGFYVDFSEVESGDAAVRTYHFLAMNVGTSARFWVGDTTTPNSTGLKTTSGVDFKPQFMMTLQSPLAAYDTEYSTVDVGAVGIGVATEDAEFTSSMTSFWDNGASEIVAKSRSDNTAVCLPAYHGEEVNMQASLDGFNDDGWKLNYSTASDNAYFFPAFAISEGIDQTPSPLMVFGKEQPTMEFDRDQLAMIYDEERPVMEMDDYQPRISFEVK